MPWHLRPRTTSSPLRGLGHSSQSSCPRALRVLMTSCACHSIPVWGAPRAIHPVWKASLRTNKMAHVCREDSVDTYLGVQIPDGQAVTMALRPKRPDAVQTHTRTHSHALSFPLAHHTLFSLCTPQALPTLHRGSSLCGAVALPLRPPRPCFHPCSTAMGITSSTCVASIRRHAGACQPRRGDRHLQVIRPRSGNTGRQMGCLDRCLPPTYPSSGMLDVTAPSPPLFEPFVTRPLQRLGSSAVVPGP